MTRSERELSRVRHWHGEVCRAAAMFECRWTLRALARVDRDLHDRLVEQRGLTDQAFVTGELEDVETHAAALCRGWTAAVRAMEASGAEDDAYLLGWDRKTGARVAIGERVCADRVVELHGQRTVLLTPDEVATMFSALEGFKTIDAIKRAFPGAEIVDVRHDEPAKADSFGAAA